MAYLYLMLLIAMVAVPMAMTVKKPARIYEYPFFMAFAFGAFIVPQALSLVRFPGGVRDSSVEGVMLMSCLCLGACFGGYRLRPSPIMMRWATRSVDLNRLLYVAWVFIGASYAMSRFLSTTDVQYSASGGMTGGATILLFFYGLAYPGFAIAVLCVFRRRTLSTVAACVLGSYLPLKDVILGRRENLTMLVMILVMVLFYERRKQPPRFAAIGALLFAMLAIPATTDYRRYSGNQDWDAVRNIDFVGSFKSFVSEESPLELRQGAAVIESARETGNYQSGKAYWNQVVFRYVPAQLLGADLKQSLTFDVWDLSRNHGTESGFEFEPGMTVTGMGDSFLQFGWLGCLFFAFMAVIFKSMWQASLMPNGLFARLMYILSITSGMRAVTHWTLDFLPGLLYFVIFLGLAAWYASAPRRRVAANSMPLRNAAAVRVRPPTRTGHQPV